MQKIKQMFYKDRIWVFILLFPNLLIFLIFTVFPVVATFGISFTSWDLLGSMEWVGLENYLTLFRDKTFLKVTGNTFYFTVVSVPLCLIISFFMAVLLDSKIKLLKLWRAIYFLPVISSMVVVAIVWNWLYNPQFGLVNYFLGLIGIEGPAWLSDTTWAMPAVIITNIWKNMGYNMMLFLAGLQSISSSYYEAAELDGANFWQKIRYITFPMISFTTLFVIITSVIGSFQVFDLVMMMTDGGPARSTSVMVHYLYQNAFSYFKMGYACSQAVVLTLIVLILTLLQFKFVKVNDISE
ncbi:sugar ABC transporter permease [Eisenbergiella tayi]|nr:sugar ABC transporter permease [Eisenbergiella tayi]ODR46348.1 sugar ABC transporter permease [Eisenbergiella tayi]OIZ59869.1 sugar ABC transporter permease [Eisenbergiella tayi]